MLVVGRHIQEESQYSYEWCNAVSRQFLPGKLTLFYVWFYCVLGVFVGVSVFVVACVRLEG